jgi:hypothetical protein
VGKRWEGPGGLDVEVISLDRCEVMRVRRHRVLMSDCRSVADLEEVLRRCGLTLADLEETGPRTSAATPRAHSNGDGEQQERPPQRP